MTPPEPGDAIRSTPYGSWQPLPLAEATALFVDAPFRWWVSGGHALELHLGESWRDHDDTDISLRRADTPLLRDQLDGWDIHVAAAGVLSPWSGDELQAELHQNNLWVRRDASAPWSLDVTVGDGTEDEWVYRRDASIRAMWDAAVLRSPDDIPYLAPEWQLLFKCLNPRPKDDVDAAHVIPHLEPSRRDRLFAALGTEHAWVQLGR